ncbi:hypothetical protein [Streptomyces swartbergensis]|uniref:hypothetical protein n=1 Tax=Streptomyces swartbergensis TaxID=487165 RepID=UPI00142D51B0|nr:hypothetical protein [Streptomyces swartbergensis]
MTQCGHALAVLARAGIGTSHLDGNTRLCAATAAEALKESSELPPLGDARPGGAGHPGRAALALVTDCHPQTLRQLRWTNTMIKALAPELLTCV